LKTGKLLASGPVGSILTNDIIVEINSTDNEKLRSVLSEPPGIKSIEERKKYIMCIMSEKMEPDTLSMLLSSKNLVITHFNVRKRRLEEEFLSITKKQTV